MRGRTSACDRSIDVGRLVHSKYCNVYSPQTPKVTAPGNEMGIFYIMMKPFSIISLLSSFLIVIDIELLNTRAPIVFEITN